MAEHSRFEVVPWAGKIVQFGERCSGCASHTLMQIKLTRCVVAVQAADDEAKGRRFLTIGAWRLSV
jgi:hypothetical protein